MQGVLLKKSTAKKGLINTDEVLQERLQVMQDVYFVALLFIVLLQVQKCSDGFATIFVFIVLSPASQTATFPHQKEGHTLNRASSQRQAG